MKENNASRARSAVRWTHHLAATLSLVSLACAMPYTTIGGESNANPGLLLLGYAGMEQRKDAIPLAFRTTRLKEACERLLQLYQDLDKPQQVTEWREKSESFSRKTPPPESGTNASPK